MTWIHRLNSTIRRFFATQRRKKSTLRTVSVLRRLDDRLLADIGIPSSRVAEYARKVAHEAVPVAAMRNPGRTSVLARLGSWMERQAAIRELSSLDQRILSDIGIEPGRVGDVVDGWQSRRRDLDTAHPVVQLADAVQEGLAPARPRHRVPASTLPDPRMPIGNAHRAKVGAEETPEIRALIVRAGDESQSPERRRHASAGM